MSGITCPTSPAKPDGSAHTIIGCGSSNVEGPDDEGIYDCCDCGMWFDPQQEVVRGPGFVYEDTEGDS